jgi:hypothetical protein
MALHWAAQMAAEKVATTAMRLVELMVVYLVVSTAGTKAG